MADAPQPDKLAELNRLAALSDEDLATVVRAGRHVHLPADKAYLIVDGEVSVRKAGEEIARLGPGDVIGEMAIVNHKLRSASVVSLTPLEVIHFTKESREELLDQVPAFGAAIRDTTSERLGDTRD